MTITIPRNRVSLTIDEVGTGKVLINDVDVSSVVSAKIDFRNDAEDGPRLTLRVLGAAHIESDSAEVVVDDETARLLADLGWTAPGDACPDCGQRLTEVTDRRMCTKGETTQRYCAACVAIKNAVSKR